MRRILAARSRRPRRALNCCGKHGRVGRDGRAAAALPGRDPLTAPAWHWYLLVALGSGLGGAAASSFPRWWAVWRAHVSLGHAGRERAGLPRRRRARRAVRAVESAARCAGPARAADRRRAGWLHHVFGVFARDAATGAARRVGAAAGYVVARWCSACSRRRRMRVTSAAAVGHLRRGVHAAHGFREPPEPSVAVALEPHDFGRDRAVGAQVDHAITGRAVVHLEVDCAA